MWFKILISADAAICHFCSYIALLTNIQSITLIFFSQVSVPSQVSPSVEEKACVSMKISKQEPNLNNEQAYEDLFGKKR